MTIIAGTRTKLDSIFLVDTFSPIRVILELQTAGLTLE